MSSHDSSDAMIGDEYLARWSVAMENRQFDQALALVDEALQAASKDENAANLTFYSNLKDYTTTIQAAFAGETTTARTTPTCSMCGKGEADGCILVAGADCVICDACIRICLQIVDQKRRTLGRELECSFCGKKQYEVSKIIAGPGVAICDNCCNTCAEILARDSG